jgi:hypothetical protein
MALAIITVRIRPLAPTNEPATINTLLNNNKPAKAAAIPEKELSKDITTGISPPPIGKTKPMPPSKTKTNNTVKNSKVGTNKGVIKTEYRRNANEI